MSDTKIKCLYLHIGLEKTGTTSIQDFLELNREKLTQDGIFVPQSLGYKNHKKIAAYGFDAGSRDIAVTSNDIGPEEADMEAFRAGLEESLTAEFEDTEAETAIISSEDLSRLFSLHEVERVLEFLGRFCETLKIVVFVRRQDLLASSRHYSLVLGGGVPLQVLPGKGEGGQRYYNYNDSIGNWIEAAGAENVIYVRFPESPSSEKFDSVQAFSKVVGIDADGLERGKRQHISYDAINQIVIHNYNRIKGDYDPEATERLMAHLAEYNDRGLTHIPSAQQAKEFYDRYRASNEALLERLGAEDQAFSDDFSMYPETNMRAAYTGKAIQRLLRIMKANDIL